MYKDTDIIDNNNTYVISILPSKCKAEGIAFILNGTGNSEFEIVYADDDNNESNQKGWKLYVPESKEMNIQVILSNDKASKWKLTPLNQEYEYKIQEAQTGLILGMHKGIFIRDTTSNYAFVTGQGLDMKWYIVDFEIETKRLLH